MCAWKVGVVGGGPGGLMVSYFLQKIASAPLSMTGYEASGRLGGKVLTPRFKKAPVHYEAGAAEFYDYSDVGEDELKELVFELGLSIGPIEGNALVMNQQTLTTLDDICDQLGPDAHRDLIAFDRAAKDWMSPREYYAHDNTESAGVTPGEDSFDAHLGKIVTPATRRYIERLIHSDLATEPQRTSVAYGLQNYLMNDPRYMRHYSIVGGNEQFIAELARRVEVDWRMLTKVTEIGRGADGLLEVTSLHAGETRVDSFDRLVIALPNNYLPTVKFRGERLAQAMTAHHDHYDHPAHYLRITILFEKQYWQGDLHDSYCMLDHFGGCCLYDESSRSPESPYGVLGWLLGGDAAEEYSERSDAELIALALDSLPPSLQAGRKLFVEGQVHRWLNSVNAMPGGRTSRSLDRRHQPEPIEHPDLLVVGDYLFDSTLNGLLDSAEYVAYWLAAQMTET